jgi:hypothetical protein
LTAPVSGGRSQIRRAANNLWANSLNRRALRHDRATIHCPDCAVIGTSGGGKHHFFLTTSRLSATQSLVLAHARTTAYREQGTNATGANPL